MLLTEAEFNDYKKIFETVHANKEKQKLENLEKRQFILPGTAQTIYIYDLNNNLINTYLSQKQAAQGLKIARSTLQRHLKLSTPITLSDKSTILITNKPLNINPLNNTIPDIKQNIIKSDNIINVDNKFEDIIDNNSIKLPISQSQQNSIIKNENENLNNYIIKNNNLNKDPIMEPIRKLANKAIKIYSYDSNNNLINQFESIAMASRFFKVSKSTIMRHVKNKKPLVKDNINYYLKD
ncbi:hypothetical protein KL927_005435 [Ogataea polymorpha]|nr:hypothetical protein KL927_005435 [Ogataea polymorpha]